jgi:DivIVA domain-containing protein
VVSEETLMPLTPADVTTSPSRRRRSARGFDADDVDEFLREVEHELARLIQENTHLRTLLDGAGEASAAAAADQLLSTARATAQQITQQAQVKADALEQDARRRHREAVSAVDAKRLDLQRHIQQLEQFDRHDYAGLKTHLENQISDLDRAEHHDEPDSSVPANVTLPLALK